MAHRNTRIPARRRAHGRPDPILYRSQGLATKVAQVFQTRAKLAPERFTAGGAASSWMNREEIQGITQNLFIDHRSRRFVQDGRPQADQRRHPGRALALDNAISLEAARW